MPQEIDFEAYVYHLSDPGLLGLPPKRLAMLHIGFQFQVFPAPILLVLVQQFLQNQYNRSGPVERVRQRGVELGE
jgi:hypothetical protein